MIFRRINKTTINCIISQQDLIDNNIRMDDFFEKKKAAMEYLRSVVMEAARKENFNLQGEYTTMRISVLPDHSISLTLSEGYSPAREAAANSLFPPGTDPDALPGRIEMPASYAKDNGLQGEYVFLFSTMEEIILCCRHVVSYGETAFESSLYQGTEGYYLLIRKTQQSGTEFEKLVFSMNEFGELLNVGAGRMAFIKEHERCILEKNAVQVLAAL